MKRLGGSVAVAACVAITRDGWADELPRTRARLAYIVANEVDCPDESSFKNLVAARLGYEPFVEDATTDVRVEIVKQQTRLSGRIEITRNGAKGGRRELTSESPGCAPLATALATTLAIALDPGQSPPQDPAPPPTPPPAPTTLVVVHERDIPTAPPPPVPKAPATSKTLLFVALDGTGTVAVGPGPMIGMDAALGARRDLLSVELSARGETTLGEPRGSAGDPLEATVFAGTLAPCAHFRSLAGCGFGRLGSFQGRAPNVVDPKVSSSLFAAVGLRAGYTLDLASVVSLRALVEAGVPLVRTSLEIDGSAVWTAPPVFLGLALGGVMNFR